MQLVDTHCHIHFSDYKLDPDEVLAAARSKGVEQVICVGCTLADSQAGVEFAARRPGVWSAVGIHPHEVKNYNDTKKLLRQLRNLLNRPKVIAVGEIGLDYFYMHSPKKQQMEMFRVQIEIAVEHKLPIIFHVRDAFDDFWKVLDDYRDLKGVVHSFSATTKELDETLSRGFYLGLNGIMTFTKNPEQLAAARQIPLDKILLETDAPFLTPAPFRGKICEPGHVRVTAEFLAKLRGESLDDLAAATTRNARELFGI